MRDGCVFCDYDGPSIVEFLNGDAYAIQPVNPVVPGHMLVVAAQHVTDFAHVPVVSGRVMETAAKYAANHYHGDFNIITSKGAAATQTVNHLHVHIVPRHEDDGLQLPWSPPPPDWERVAKELGAPQ